MYQCISILASFSLGLSIGGGGTAIGNTWWASYDKNAVKSNIGLWSFCTEATGSDRKCEYTWDIESIKDSPFFLATLAAWTGGLVFMVLAQILWIVFTCRKGHSKGCLVSTIGFAFLAFGCWLATVLIWWLRLLEDDDALPSVVRDNLEFDWAYWVAVGSTGMSLIAVILTSVTGYCARSGTSV